MSRKLITRLPPRPLGPLPATNPNGENIRDLNHARTVLKRYSEYYDTKTLKEYVTGNREQRQWIIQAANELKLMPTTEGSLDIKMNITEMIDGYSGHEHTIPTFPLQADLIKLLAEVIPKRAQVEDYEVEHEFADLGRRTMLLNARRLDRGGDGCGELLHHRRHVGEFGRSAVLGCGVQQRIDLGDVRIVGGEVVAHVVQIVSVVRCITGSAHISWAMC